MNQVKAGVILNYIIIGISTISGLVYTPYMLRCLGQNEYGLYSLVGSLIAYLTLLDFGFGSAIVRFTAKIRATGSQEDEWRLYGMFMIVNLIISLFITIGGLVLYLNIDNLFECTMSPEELSKARIMMVFMIANLALTFPLGIYGSIMSAYENFVFQKLLSIAGMILSTSAMIAILAMGYKAIGLVAVQTLFGITLLLINFIYCKIKLKVKLIFSDLDFSLLKDIMAFSWWNFLGTITDRIYWSLGQIVLGAVCGTVAIAVYSVAVALMNMYMTMSCALNSVLLPRITKMACTPGNETAISDLFIRTGRLQFCILALITSGFAIFGNTFITLWAEKGYTESYYIALMFFIVLLCPLIQNVGITIMQARGQIKFRSICYLIISLSSLLGQYILGKQYGAFGCGVAVTLALFAGQWITMNLYYYHKQHIDIKTFWQQIIKMAVLPTILTMLGMIIMSRISIASWLHLISAIGIYTLAYIPLFWKFSMGDHEKNQFRPLIQTLRLTHRFKTDTQIIS